MYYFRWILISRHPSFSNYRDSQTLWTSEWTNSVFQNLEFREKKTVIGSFNAMTFSMERSLPENHEFWWMMLAIAIFLWVLPRKSSSRYSSSLPIQNVLHPGFANFVHANIRLCSLHYSMHQRSHNKSGQGSFFTHAIWKLGKWSFLCVTWLVI